MRAVGCCILAALLVLLCLVVPPATMAQEPAPIGWVAGQTGAATVLRNRVPAPLIVGAPVFRADHVTTGAETRLTIEFTDGSSVVLGPGCALSIEEFTTDPKGGRLSAVLSLLRGIVRAIVNPAQAGGFEVRTETAIASARSTDWTVEVAPGTTAVLVLDGTVAVAGRAGGEVVLEPGEGTDVAAGQPPTPPVRWGEQRRARTLSLIGL